MVIGQHTYIAWVEEEYLLYSRSNSTGLGVQVTLTKKLKIWNMWALTPGTREVFVVTLIVLQGKTCESFCDFVENGFSVSTCNYWVKLSETLSLLSFAGDWSRRISKRFHNVEWIIFGDITFLCSFLIRSCFPPNFDMPVCKNHPQKKVGLLWKAILHHEPSKVRFWN